MSTPIERRWTSLDTLFKSGVIVVVAVLSISLAVAAGRFDSAFGANALDNAPQAQLSIVLLIASCALIAIWFYAVSGETEILQAYLGDFIPTLPDLRLYAVTVAVLLGLFVYFSDRPIIYAAAYIVFKIISVWGHVKRRDLISRALLPAYENAQGDSVRQRKLKAIEHYYLEKPHIRQVDIVPLCLAASALIFSTISQVFDELTGRGHLETAAYGLLILGFLAQEGFIFNWRKERDAVLDED